METVAEKRDTPGTGNGGWAGALLNLVERAGNRLPDPLLLFVFIAVAIPFVSFAIAASGWTLIHPGTGEPLRAVNLLQTQHLRRMLTDAVPNFVGFPPLGVVLVALMGVGIAERSGLLAALLRMLVSALPGRVVTAGVVLAGLLSNVASDAGYVVLVPLAGVVFASVGRHPVAGICAAFAGVSGGFSANLVISTLDPMLAAFTQSAAQLLDAGYSVHPAANYYFMVVSTLLLVAVGTFVSEKIVEPRLGPWKPEAGVSSELPQAVSGAERRATWMAIGSALLFTAGVALLVVPRDGFLRGPDGSLDPFYKSLVPLMALGFLMPGIVYGIAARTVESVRTASRMIADTLGSMGGYILLAFVAAQFIAYFAWSNLGIMFAIAGAEALNRSGLPTSLLLVGVVLVAATVNLFIGSASAKWALMSPVLVPLMMELGLSPEMAQATYRVGDSVTNIITPLMPYFPIVVAFAQKWSPRLGLGTFLAGMLPYSVAFLVVWSLLLLGWYWMDLPLGPGSPILYNAGAGGTDAGV